MSDGALELDGVASIGGQAWYRGCYAFDACEGECVVEQSLELFVRSFSRQSGCC